MIYEVCKDKIMLSIINPNTREQEQYLFGRDEVVLEVEGGTLWFTFEGKKYESIDSPAAMTAAGLIKPKENADGQEKAH